MTPFQRCAKPAGIVGGIWHFVGSGPAGYCRSWRISRRAADPGNLLVLTITDRPRILPGDWIAFITPSALSAREIMEIGDDHLEGARAYRMTAP